MGSVFLLLVFLKYNKLPNDCQIPSWIKCNLEGNVESNAKDEISKSSVAVDMHDGAVHRTRWIHSCNGNALQHFLFP